MREDLPDPTRPTTHASSPGPTLMFTSRNHQVASGASLGLVLLPFFTCPDDASLAVDTTACLLSRPAVLGLSAGTCRLIQHGDIVFKLSALGVGSAANLASMSAFKAVQAMDA